MVTKEQMKCYEDIRQSGVTNMYDVTTVVALSEGVLDKEACFEIMKNYGELMKKHEIER